VYNSLDDGSKINPARELYDKLGINRYYNMNDELSIMDIKFGRCTRKTRSKIYYTDYHLISSLTLISDL
jgi:hypothetical protein